MAESYLQVEESDGVTLVGFPENAELDAAIVDQVGRELFSQVESGDQRKVVISFEHLGFLSSQAIGVLLTLRLKAARTGSEVVLAAVPSAFDDIFRLTNFEQLYEIFQTVADAKAHFGVEA